MRTIVVGYDETEPAKRALTRAAEFADVFGAKLIVASVAPSGVGHLGDATDPTDSPEQHVAILEGAREGLGDPKFATEFIAAIGAPADAIIELARDRRADLVVVGTRELNFVQRILGQSVSESVAHHTHCDVLIVH